MEQKGEKIITQEKNVVPTNALHQEQNTSAPMMKIHKETRRERNEQIHTLEEEIEEIKLADAKMKDAELRGIPKEAIADNVSMAGFSIPERLAKIQELKSEQSTGSKKHWWQKAAVVASMTLAGLFASKQASGQQIPKSQTKNTTENNIQVKETPKEAFLAYEKSLIEKADTAIVSADDMEGYIERWENLNDGELAELYPDNTHAEVLNKLFEKHNPYALDGKQIPYNLIPSLVTGYGFDKEDRVLMTQILTEVGFDASKIEVVNKDTINNKEYITDFIFNDEIVKGDKILRLNFENIGGGGKKMWFSIRDTKTGKQVNFICGDLAVSKSVGKIDRSKFKKELDALLNSH